MAEVLELSRPLKIFGGEKDRELTELPYDFENMTARDKLNAGKKMRQDGMQPGVEELDTDYHLFLFAEAVCKADSSIDIADVLRISAKDAHKAAALARNFFYLGSAE